MKIGIIVGHDKTSPGAYSKRLSASEYTYNSEVASYLAGIADIYKRPIGGNYRSQMRKLADIINPKQYDLVIELHFNAFNKIAEGCETVSYPGNTLALQYGGKLCTMISSAYQTKNRGAKEAVKGGRGWWFLHYMKPTAIIVEPFFGDSSEASKFTNEALYANILKTWLCP